MKQILSYNSEYDDICVIKAVSEAEAPDAFRAYVKERAVELLEIADNEVEELMAHVDADLYAQGSANLYAGDEAWRSLSVEKSDLFTWDE